MLDHLNPREFEEYCQVLFMCHYRCFVELTPQSGDEGRDLLIHLSGGLLVAECKHYLASTVGRPIVQKLHSAVLTKNSRHGMIVTTGRFSAEAEEYARKLKDVKMDLVDQAKLALLISTTMSNSPVTSSLAAGMRTTPDAHFASAFARSIFCPPRYRRRHSIVVPVHVDRSTRYWPFYVATFDAAGRISSAVGTHTANWDGAVWIRGDGKKIGFGTPRPSGAPLPAPIPFGDIFKEISGEVESPDLQPHQAVATLKEFVVSNCARSIAYRGRNNVVYSRTITPNPSDVQVYSLVLYYVPRQYFVLRIGDAVHEGSVEEIDKPASFYVQCESLSTCIVCGTATTERNQILCAICFKPAHCWSVFFPDSFRCRSCGATVCRRHTVKKGRRRLCTGCGNGGRRLAPRWVGSLIFGVIVSALCAIGALISGKNGPVAFLTASICSWLPLLRMLLQPLLGAKHRPLRYAK